MHVAAKCRSGDKTQKDIRRRTVKMSSDDGH